MRTDASYSPRSPEEQFPLDETNKLGKAITGNKITLSSESFSLKYLIDKIAILAFKLLSLSKPPMPIRTITALAKQPPSFIESNSHGKISIEQAIKRLSMQPDGTGLLRESTTTKALTLSYVKNGQVVHTRLLQGRTIEEVMKNEGITRLVSPHSQEQKQIELEELRSPIVGKYDHQMILNLGSGRSAKGLNFKAQKNNLPSETIDLRQSNTGLSPLSKLTPSSRLYIIGHCGPGKDFIESDEKDKVTVDQFVEMLKQHAQKLKNGSPEHKITVSIVACQASVDDKAGNKSFGYRLSEALDKAGIPAEVHARAGIVSRGEDDPKDYKKYVDGKYHEQGSKQIFITENGHTTMTQHVY